MEQTIYKEFKINRVKHRNAEYLSGKAIFRILIEDKKTRFISRTSSIEKTRGSRDTFFIVCEHQKDATDRFKDFVSFCFDNNINIKATFNSLTIEII